MKKLLAILSVVLFATQANAETWACAGWDDGGSPQPFMMGYGEKSNGTVVEGFLLTSEEKYGKRESFKIPDESLEDFLKGKYMTLLAHRVKRRNDDGSLVLYKEEALLVIQRTNKLELSSIEGMSTLRNDQFEMTKRTYCNEIK